MNSFSHLMKRVAREVGSSTDLTNLQDKCMTCKSFVCISDCYFLSLRLFLNYPKQCLSRILSLMISSAFLCATSTGIKSQL